MGRVAERSRLAILAQRCQRWQTPGVLARCVSAWVYGPNGLQRLSGPAESSTAAPTAVREWSGSCRGSSRRGKMSRALLTRWLHGFFTKLFDKRVTISARARDKIPRPTRTPSGTRTFSGPTSQSAVNVMIVWHY